MGYHLGVDLGTTFVAAAIANESRVEMFTLGDRTVVTPAVVFLGDDGTLVSGDAAGRRAVSSPDRIGREFKRRLGDPTPVMLGGTLVRGDRRCSAPCCTTWSTGSPRPRASKPDSVVLTHPANWGPFRRELFEEVPQVAGPDRRPGWSPSRRPRRRTTRRPGTSPTARSSPCTTWAAAPSTPPCCARPRRHRDPRRPGGHRAARRRRLRRGDPVLRQLLRRRRAVRAGHERPADGDRAWPGCARTACWPRSRCRSTPRPRSRCSCPTGTSTCS